METEMQLSVRLKTETRAAHDRIETLPFSRALARGELALQSYVAQLQAYVPMHEALDDRARTCEHVAVRAVWRESMAKLPLLEKDLAFFAGLGLAPVRAALDRGREVGRAIEHVAEVAPVALLGWLYVLEGSTLGGAFLRPLLVRSLHLPEHAGTAYYAPYGREVAARWAETRTRLDATSLSAREADVVVREASRAFELVGSILAAIIPVQATSDAAAE
jgi:heme oxygenase